MHISYSNINTNTQITLNQEFYKDNFHLLYLLGLSGAKKRILDVLLKYDTLYPHVRISLSKIAGEARVSVRHTSRCLLELERSSILTRVHQGYRAPLVRYANNYILSPLFHELWSRKELSYKYPILKWVDEEMLCEKNAISTGHFSKNVLVSKTKRNDSTISAKSEEDLINFPPFYQKGSTQTAVPKARAPKAYNLLAVSALSSRAKSKPKEAFTEARGEVMAKFLDKLRELENFGNYEMEKLEGYSDKLLVDAYSKLQEVPNVTNAFSLLLSICKRLATYPRYKAAAAKESGDATAASRNRFGNESRGSYGSEKSQLPPMEDGSYTVQPGDKGMPVGCTVYGRYEHPDYDGTPYEKLRKSYREQSSFTDEVEPDTVKEEIRYAPDKPGATETKEVPIDKARTLEDLEKALGEKFNPFDYYAEG